MEKKRVSQLQCPNCGEYRMSKVEDFGWGAVLLSVITFGLYALVKAIIASRTPDPQVNRGDRVKCLSCGSRWIFER